MLIVVVLTFAICNLPFHARKIWQYWSRHYEGASDFNALFTPRVLLQFGRQSHPVRIPQPQLSQGDAVAAVLLDEEALDECIDQDTAAGTGE